MRSTSVVEKTLNLQEVTEMFAQKGANGDKTGRLLAFSLRHLYSRDLPFSKRSKGGEACRTVLEIMFTKR